MSRQQFEYHPVIGYHFIPGLKARVEHDGGDYLIRVNQAGFRCDHEFVKEKLPSRRRILLFGDSFTAGDGVSNGKRYGNLLEAKIPNLEVYNFGLPGTGTDQHYLTFQEYASGIEHDLLVISVLVENIRRVAAHYRISLNDRGENICHAKPYYQLVDGKLVLKQVPPPKRLIRESEIPESEREKIDRGGRFQNLRDLVNKTGLKDLAQKFTHYQPVPEYDRPDDPVWRVMRAILEEWIRPHPRRVVLMPIPLYQFIEETSDPSAYQARFREVASATGCVLHDPLPDFFQYPLEERRRFRFAADPHLTPQGHEALASSLAPILQNLLEPPKPGARK